LGATSFWWRWLDFLLGRFYDELAWAYDAVSWLASLGRWAAWRRVALRYVEGQHILEIGCGTGHLLPALAARGGRVCGGDLSAAMLRLARRRAGPDTPLCRLQAQALPFGPASFDTILCTFPAPFIRDRRTWAEFERVLSPGGRVVVVYGVSLQGHSLGQRLRRGLLALGRTRGRDLRPAWPGCRFLRVERLVVEEGEDRVGVLLGMRAAWDSLVARPDRSGMARMLIA